MTTTATTPIIPDLYLDWLITVELDPGGVVGPPPKTLQLNLSEITWQNDNVNNPYAILSGTISEESLFSAPIYGIVSTYVITFHFYSNDDLYIFTGVYEGATTIKHGYIYKNDPTDEGSWSGTAQNGTGHPNTPIDGFFGKNARVPTPSLAPV